MKINTRENYGFGPCLATRQERLARAAFFVLFAASLASLGVALWT